jgi:3,4-dihydroxy 2-butanone 4-phosphate synthase / GTP cyclohydrolase II
LDRKLRPASRPDDEARGGFINFAPILTPPHGVVRYDVGTMFSPIEEVLDELKAGRCIVLVDDEDRENEGDLVIPAQTCTSEVVNFMLSHARGLICVALSAGRCRELALHPQTDVNTAQLGTAFTVTVDAHPKYGVTTGVSAKDRAMTIEVLHRDDTTPGDLLRPGHINPLRARDGGVLVRAGQTEGSVDLARMAGFKEAAVICEIMRPDGEMARRDDLVAFCKTHHLKMCTVADLISYRMKREQLIQRIESIPLPTRWGNFQLYAYQSQTDPEPHLALTMGGIGEVGPDNAVKLHDEPVLVRVHSECLTGDVFGSQRCDCGLQLDQAMQQIALAGKGVLVYLRQEGRGIGLANKLRAYRLQDTGLDTVDANLRLGLPADKRDYGIGVQILRDLGLRKLRILTNNPKKIYGIDGFGLEVVDQVPIVTTANEFNQKYIDTKRARMGHTL